MKLQTAKGVQDIAPEEKIVKNKLVDTLKEVFEEYGFAPLETPIIERIETLTAKGGAGTSSDVSKETFQLSDQGKRKLGLRFELTTSLARFLAQNPQTKLPFKRYEVGPVFRDGPIKAGRMRQFWQCDIDTIGSKSMLADAELLAVVQKVFNQLEQDIIIKVNNRKLLNGILESAGFKTKKEDAIVAIDKLEKIGVQGVTAELLDRGYKKKQIDSLFELIEKGISLRDLEKKLENEEALTGIKELEELFGYLEIMGVKSAVFDVSLARGLGYYTGPIFEVFAKSSKVTSSIAGGGRWDDMIGKFMGGGRVVPAVGISFGLVPILEVMKEKEEFKKRTPAQVYIVPIKTVEKSLEIVQRMRDKGICTEFDLNGRGMGKNMQYANSLGIPFVAIIGEQELKQNKIMLRDMVTGDQELLSVAEVIKKLKRM